MLKRTIGRTLGIQDLSEIIIDSIVDKLSIAAKFELRLSGLGITVTYRIVVVLGTYHPTEPLSAVTSVVDRINRLLVDAVTSGNFTNSIKTDASVVVGSTLGDVVVSTAPVITSTNTGDRKQQVHQQQSESFSPKAIAGIVVGCFVGLILIIIGAYFMRKKILALIPIRDEIPPRDSNNKIFNGDFELIDNQQDFYVL